jgi:hypothetical protein
MPAKDRDAFVTANLESMEPLVAEAILTAPAWLSGVADSHRALLFDKALQSQFGDDMVKIQELERAIEVAESAVETGRDEIRLDAEVADPRKFDELAAPIEAKQSVMWLRRSHENGVDVVRKMEWVDGDRTKGGAWAVATPEDVSKGVFYDSAEAYFKDNPAQEILSVNQSAANSRAA